MIDLIVVIIIVAGAIFGLIRGVVGQIMSLAGLVAAYFLAPSLGHGIAPFVQRQCGCSLFMAEKGSIFLMGIGIYVGARLLGFGVERLVVDRVREFKKINRLGGAGLGALKMVILVGVVFWFVTLVPHPVIRSWLPKLPESRTYQWASKYNPMGKPNMLEPMRRLRSVLQNPELREKFTSNPATRAFLNRHGVPGAFSDDHWLKALKAGDYDSVARSEEMEKVMNDHQLVELLGKFEKEPSR